MKLFDAANQYCRESDWKTLAMLKFCLLALGIAVGVLLPEGIKTPVLAVCAVVFVVTYIPLMRKLILLLKR